MQSISQAVEQHNSPGKIHNGREVVLSAPLARGFFQGPRLGQLPMAVLEIVADGQARLMRERRARGRPADERSEENLRAVREQLVGAEVAGS